MGKIGVVGGAPGEPLWPMLPLPPATRSSCGRAMRQRSRRSTMAGRIRDICPAIEVDKSVVATADLGAAAHSEAILMVVPAQATRSVAQKLAGDLAVGVPLVLCAKGIEQATGKLMSEVVGEVLPGHKLAVLSGPTFADEVAKGLPTAVTLACVDPATGDKLTEMLGTPYFRPYATTDIVGAQIGGALKNVVAIACGIIEGRVLGRNGRAALISRGIAEMARFGAALGAQENTLLGLSGLGDLTLTCTTSHSRNYALGIGLGTGDITPAIIADPKQNPHLVTEGVHTGPGVLARAAAFQLDMPIAAAVTQVIHQGADIGHTIEALLNRPFRREQGGDADPSP